MLYTQSAHGADILPQGVGHVGGVAVGVAVHVVGHVVGARFGVAEHPGGGVLLVALLGLQVRLAPEDPGGRGVLVVRGLELRARVVAEPQEVGVHTGGGVLKHPVQGVPLLLLWGVGRGVGRGAPPRPLLPRSVLPFLELSFLFSLPK